MQNRTLPDRKIQIGSKRVFQNIAMPKALKPQLILAGNWLEKAGFQRGDVANIQVKEKQLIITIA